MATTFAGQLTPSQDGTILEGMEQVPLETRQFDDHKVSFRRLGRGHRHILFFHGFPGSSLQISPFADHLEGHSLDIVAVDRPGYAESSLRAGSQLAANSENCRRLIDALGWERFEVMSVSGGTPFLFDFVRTFPERILKATIISGLGPVASLGFRGYLGGRSWLALTLLPMIPTFVFRRLFPRGQSAPTERGMALIRRLLPASKSDVEVLMDRETQLMLVGSLIEAFQQGGVGPQRDAREFVKPWSPEIPSYHGPIDIWHGAQDEILPVGLARRLAAAIPRARLRVLPNEGHYSLALKHIPAVLDPATADK